MNVYITSQQEIIRLIKEQSDKDRKHFEDMIHKLTLKIDDLQYMKKD